MCEQKRKELALQRISESPDLYEAVLRSTKNLWNRACNGAISIAIHEHDGINGKYEYMEVVAALTNLVWAEKIVEDTCWGTVVYRLAQDEIENE